MAIINKWNKLIKQYIKTCYFIRVQRKSTQNAQHGTRTNLFRKIHQNKERYLGSQNDLKTSNTIAKGLVHAF